MSDIIEKSPQIRFKGFTDAWEQSKLGEIGETFTGLSGKNKDDFGHGDAKFITYMNVFSNPISDLNGVDAIEVDNKQNKVKCGDVLFTTSSETPEEVGMSSVWLGNSEHVYLNSFCFGYRPTVKINSYYLAYMLRSPSIRSNFKLLAQGISRYNISKNKVMDMEISQPTITEQKLIGEYFYKLDNLITLYQRKLELLKETKRGMLQKMFPKDGETIPEIRFAGFTDAWEKCELGEIVERVTRKNTDLQSTLPLTISAQYGLIDQNEFFDKRIASKDVSGYYVIKNGEFAYNKSTSNDAPWGAIKRLDRYDDGVLSTLYIVFKIINDKNISSDFIARYYDTNLWHKGIRVVAAEGARNHGLLNIAPNDFFATTLYLPKNIKEQKLIGDYFNNMDNLITLHQHELDLFKKLKKSMLQQMFI